MYGVQYGQQYSGSEDSLGQAFTKALTDAVNVSSSLIKTTGKLLISSVVVASTLAKRITRTFSDAVSIIDQTVEAAMAFGLILVDSIVVTSSIVKSTTKAIVDSVVSAEIFAKHLTITRIFTDSVVVASVIAKTISKTISDSLSVAESIIMKLNGSTIRWWSIVKNTVVNAWTNTTRTLGSWTDTNRVTSSWTEQEKEE